MCVSQGIICSVIARSSILIFDYPILISLSKSIFRQFFGQEEKNEFNSFQYILFFFFLIVLIDYFYWLFYILYFSFLLYIYISSDNFVNNLSKIYQVTYKVQRIKGAFKFFRI